MLPELANSYSPTKNYDLGFWLSSPKLDGLRCIYTRDGKDRGLRSRSGTTRYVGGFDRLELECRAICDANNLSFLDGELYIPTTPFDIISGLVRDRTNYEITEKYRVEFRIFAIGSATNPNMKAQEMVALIEQIIPVRGMISYIPQKLIRNTPSDIQAEAELVRAFGLSDEGIMLRNPSSVYAGVRSNNLLKVKNFVKNSFTVVGFTKGTGKFTNSLGSLLVRGMVDETIVNAKVGTGFNDSERSDMWTNQSNYLGKDVEVIYLGVTAAGSLRHPIFSRFV
ncbi:ATP-dependent DNA ligase [Microcoleus sp. D3_18a_C4]|uniref:ATP-dependent DNA ligase n=1 Tax=unclassified Microcoleus TaxID=2642155 RepID=UPI002FD6BE7B